MPISTFLTAVLISTEARKPRSGIGGAIGYCCDKPEPAISATVVTALDEHIEDGASPARPVPRAGARTSWTHRLLYTGPTSLIPAAKQASAPRNGRQTWRHGGVGSTSAEPRDQKSCETIRAGVWRHSPYTWLRS